MIKTIVYYKSSFYLSNNCSHFHDLCVYITGCFRACFILLKQLVGELFDSELIFIIFYHFEGKIANILWFQALKYEDYFLCCISFYSVYYRHECTDKGLELYATNIGEKPQAGHPLLAWQANTHSHFHYSTSITTLSVYQQQIFHDRLLADKVAGTESKVQYLPLTGSQWYFLTVELLIQFVYEQASDLVSTLLNTPKCVTRIATIFQNNLGECTQAC